MTLNSFFNAVQFAIITRMEEDRGLYCQVHFSGESKCAKFVPNPFRCNICTACSKEISKHSKDAVENEEMLMKVKIKYIVFGFVVD